jgi:ADP-ribose pyrophosphatase
MHKENKFKILKSEITYDRFLKVRRDTIQLPSEEVIDYNYVEPFECVLILPIANDRVIMLEQYRYPLKKYLYDLPAGKVDDNETLEEAALRELKEETGYTAKTIQKINSFYHAPGYSGAIVHAFVAKDLTPGKHKTDNTEFLEVKEFSIPEFEKIISTQTLEAAISATYYIAKQKSLI